MPACEGSIGRRSKPSVIRRRERRILRLRFAREIGSYDWRGAGCWLLRTRKYDKALSGFEARLAQTHGRLIPTPRHYKSSDAPVTAVVAAQLMAFPV